MAAYSKIITKMNLLPESFQKEVLDFIEFLIQKYDLKTGEVPVIPQFGCLKDTFQVAPDFDEPLDDFKEYMS